MLVTVVLAEPFHYRLVLTVTGVPLTSGTNNSYSWCFYLNCLSGVKVTMPSVIHFELTDIWYFFNIFPLPKAESSLLGMELIPLAWRKVT